MKKAGLLLFACLGLGAAVAFGSPKFLPVHAEPDEPSIVEPEDLSATVTLSKVEHGSVEASILEGQEGDICKLNVKAELLYLVSSVKVNETTLIEDENISGLYSFALTRGENIVTVTIVVNEEILGNLSTIYDEMRNKDWTQLFSVENVITLIKWVLDCGILFAIIRYYIRDKRLADKVEKTIKNEIDKIIPDATKESVIATVQNVLEPVFAQLKADNVELTRAMQAFARCMALAQENTPESRTAILEILSNLNISDEKTLAEVKAYIDKLFADHLSTYNEVMKALDNISEENKEIAEIQEEPEKEEKPADDGTSI